MKEEIYSYGVSFKRSTIFLIKEMRLELNVFGIDFPSLRDVEVLDPDDGEGMGDQFKDAEPEVTMDDIFNEGDGPALKKQMSLIPPLTKSCPCCRN